ncbi:hypothetical protein [Sulfitobacter sp.]|jgi:hypothetical protein|uniref:hypothetical protein n=1 Tax=Sulfitobacter sp. TaxID=1903071 RepID=UPI003002F08E
MVDKKPSQTPAQTAKAEEAARKQARLSQALKANMARRKGQARARNADTQESAQTGSAQDVQEKET